MDMFAKLFSTEDGGQVLITKNFDDNEDAYHLLVRTDFEGVSFEAKIGFRNEESAILAFDSFDEKNAEGHRARALELIQ